MNVQEAQLTPLTYPFLSSSILARSYLFIYEKNEYVIRTGTQLDFLFFVLAGKARIINTEANGKNVILQFIQAEDLIGDLYVVNAEKHTKDVVAIGQLHCLAIPLPIVKQHLINDPLFLTFISTYIGQKLLKRMEHFSLAQTFELKYRLAELLITVAVDGYYSENNTQIADYLGTSYRHLMHTFKKLREQNYIKKQGRGYMIDEAKLIQLITAGSKLS